MEVKHVVKTARRLLVASCLLSLNASFASTDFTWTGAGTNGTSWSDTANWTPTGAPIAAGDEAVFTGATTNQPTNTATVTLDGINFNGLGTFTVTNSNLMTIGATGIANSSALTQTIVNESGKTLTLENGGVAALVSIQNAGTFTLSNTTANDMLVAGIISGAGSLTKTGSGTTTLTAINTYTGPTAINEGVLQVGNSSTVGSINTSSNIAIAKGASVSFVNMAGSVNYTGIISGEGGLTQSDNITITLLGQNTYTGLSTVTNGKLRIGNNGVSEQLAFVSNVNILSPTPGGLVFSNANALTYSGSLSGTGQLLHDGVGALILTGDSSAFAGTSLTNGGGGIIQLGNGGTTGSLGGNMTVGAGLKFNRSNSFVHPGVLTGAGPLEQIGTGTVTLNGTSTAYTGTLTVTAGKVLLGDSTHTTAALGGNVIVGNDGTLGGHGTISGNVTSTGTVSPGGSIGTLTVTGAGGYTQTGGSYSAGFNAAGQSSQLLVTGGNITISNTALVLDVSDGFKSNTASVIINNTNALGTNSIVFTNVDALTGIMNQGFLTAQVTTPTATSVSVAPAFSTTAFHAAAATPNEIAVSNYVLATGGTPGIQATIGSLATGDTAGFNRTMDQISGATYANQALQLSQTGFWFTRQMSDRMDFYPQCEDCSDPNCVAQGMTDRCGPGRAFWVLPYGSSASIKSGDVSGLNTSMGGLAIGGDFALPGKARAGVAAASTYFSSDDTSPESGNDNGVLFQLGVYGTYPIANVLIGASIDVGGTDSVDVTRNPATNTTTPATATGSYRSVVVAEQLKASYDIALQPGHVRPFVALVGQQLSVNGSNETDDADWALSIPNFNFDSFNSQVGISSEIMVGRITLLGSAAWQHAFSDTRATFDTSVTALTGSTPFSVNGTEIGADTALIKAGVVLLSRGNMTLTASYEGIFADAYSENGGKLQINFDLA